MNGHPQMLIERRNVLASIVRNLNQMLLHLRNAQHVNNIHGLDLDLPSEKPIVEAIGVCVQKYQQPGT